MFCPKDKVPCDTKRFDDVVADVCSQCQGTWLEQVEVRRLVQHFTMPQFSNADDLLAKWDVAEHEGTLPEHFWSEDALRCPRDGKILQKHYFAGSKIGVDQCQACKGFWFDGGELHAVASYVAPNPELDQAWRSFIRDEKAWREKWALLEEQDSRLDHKTMPIGLSLGQIHPWLGVGYTILLYLFDRLKYVPWRHE